MEKQLKIVRIIILVIGLVFLGVGAGIGYVTYTGPSAGKTDQDYILPVVFIGMGLMDIMIITVWSLISGNKEKKEKWLMENGQTVKAKYTGTSVNKKIVVNNANPYNILCEWHDSLTSEVYTFKSKNIWFNPAHFIDPAKSITVYFDPADMKSYLMDTSFLPANS